MSPCEDRFCKVTSADQLASDGFAAFYRRWDAARGDKDMPHVSAIQPTSIDPCFLPHITIIGVEDAGSRFVMRLAGSAIREITNVEMTGWEVDENRPDIVPSVGAESALARMQRAVANRQPYCLAAPARWSGKDMLSQRTLVLPYAGDDGEVRRFLTLNELEFTDTPCDGCPARPACAAE